MGIIVDFLSVGTKTGKGGNNGKNKFVIRHCAKLNDDFYVLTAVEPGPFEFMETALLITRKDHDILQPQQGHVLFCCIDTVTVDNHSYRLAVNVCDEKTCKILTFERHRKKKHENNIIP